MRKGTPFHSRTSAVCDSHQWQPWAGYLSATSYQLVPGMEYVAIRHSAGLLDVTPLRKYLITGKDSQRLLKKVVTRDVTKCAEGQIMYTPWCDERGKTVDDGTLWNLGGGAYRLTAAEPNLKWLQDCGVGMDAEVQDQSDEVAVLALQGPASRAILKQAMDGGVENLRYYRFMQGRLGGAPVTVSRTGYTGDLGYEIWSAPEDAERVWDTLVEHGSQFELSPAGMLALDIARIEAGFILAEVDFVPARKAMIDSQAYSPLELSLDWAVSLDKGPFVGRRALVEETRRGPLRRVVGLEVDWKVVEKLFRQVGLPPTAPLEPSREHIPVYAGGRQIGKATSGVWSPMLKKYIAIATVASSHSRLGTVVEMEVTVEGERKRAPATVVKRPFFDPERKKS